MTTENINEETGEIVEVSGSSIEASSEQMLDTSNNQEFIHIRNDCSAGGGSFKVGSNHYAGSINATLIAARFIKDIALFTKKGEVPKPQDWVQVLFVDEQCGNLKSTLIKTRSIGGFTELINASKAVNENPCGISFSMRFSDADGENETGKFKYKYLTFEKKPGTDELKKMAVDVAEKLNSGDMPFPTFYND